MTTGVEFQLFTSSFCGACRRTHAVLDRATDLITGSTLTVHPIETEPTLAEQLDIKTTPTVIVRAPGGDEVLRASGVPNIHHVLAAGLRALEHGEKPR